MNQEPCQESSLRLDVVNLPLLSSSAAQFPASMARSFERLTYTHQARCLSCCLSESLSLSISHSSSAWILGNLAPAHLSSPTKGSCVNTTTGLMRCPCLGTDYITETNVIPQKNKRETENGSQGQHLRARDSSWSGKTHMRRSERSVVKQVRNCIKKNRRRLHVKKQRHYFANKGLSSQSYGFSSIPCVDVRVGL